jgi:isochorismate synthase
MVDGKSIIYVGGGITKDSVPENEWLETIIKSKTILSILAKN